MEEMQAAVRKNGKPTGLRMGANILPLNGETKRMIPNMDLLKWGSTRMRLPARMFAGWESMGSMCSRIWEIIPIGGRKWLRAGVLGFKTNYAAAYTNWWNSRR